MHVIPYTCGVVQCEIKRRSLIVGRHVGGVEERCGCGAVIYVRALYLISAVWTSVETLIETPTYTLYLQCCLPGGKQFGGRE